MVPESCTPFWCYINKKGSQASLWIFWSGRRGSNSRPQPWQGCALPTELLPLWSRTACLLRHLLFYYICQILLRAAVLRLPIQGTGAGEEARTLDLNLGKVALYQLSYSRFARTRLSQKPTEFPRHRYITSNLGAGEEARTLDLNLGKVALYQLSYSRLVLRAASFTTGTHYRSSMRLVKEASASF